MFAVGPISQVAVTDKQVDLSWVKASGGTGPYHYALYRSTTTGFTPGPGNLVKDNIADPATGPVTYSDTGLTPGTKYFYVVEAVDEGNGNATVDSTQLTIVTGPQSLDVNQFEMKPLVGTLTQAYNTNTIQGVIDSTQTGKLYAGQAVKQVAASTDEPGVNGMPSFVACDANSDECAGFLVRNMKDPFFVAGSVVEIARDGDVMRLFATADGDPGAQVQLDLNTVGGVKQVVGSSGACIVGHSLDPLTQGFLCRVVLTVPSFLRA